MTDANIAEAVEVIHPRPQMTRQNWTDLSGVWNFAFDDADRGIKQHWYRDASRFDKQIVVPYPPESKLSGLRETGYHPVIWYSRVVDAAVASPDGRLLLHFGAVDYIADVWVNGQHVAHHEGGHTPFCADITGALIPGSAQHIVVRAEDQPLDVTQPRGKQDWLPEPHVIWYHRTSGIWQPVWLEPVPEKYITELQLTPSLVEQKVHVELRLEGAPASLAHVETVLRLRGEVIAAQTVRITDNIITFDVAIPALGNSQNRKGLVWSVDNPNLIDVTVALIDEAGQERDAVASYFGMRSVGIGKERFLLNGRGFYLRMVLQQAYWPESHLAAPSPEALKKEVELIKALGFNGVRIHQKVEDPRFLYWCDRLGLLVWGEMANAFEFTPRAVERLTREWLDVVRRDRSHPSIVAWVPMNESWGAHDIATRKDQQAYATALYHLTKALDPTRPVISNDGWEHTTSDIWGVHDYMPNPDVIRGQYHTAEGINDALYGSGPQGWQIMLNKDEKRNGQPVMLTEVGGLSFNPSAGTKWFGYATAKSPEEFTKMLSDIMGAILTSPYVAGFCYTQLTDTEQETNGLLTENREPKIPFEVVRDILNQPAASIPAEEVQAYRKRAFKASGIEQG